MIYKTIPFCQVPVSLIESQTSYLLKYKALMLMEQQTNKPQRNQILLQIVPRNCLNKL